MIIPTDRLSRSSSGAAGPALARTRSRSSDRHSSLVTQCDSDRDGTVTLRHGGHGHRRGRVRARLSSWTESDHRDRFRSRPTADFLKLAATPVGRSHTATALILRPPPPPASDRPRLARPTAAGPDGGCAGPGPPASLRNYGLAQYRGPVFQSGDKAADGPGPAAWWAAVLPAHFPGSVNESSENFH